MAIGSTLLLAMETGDELLSDDGERRGELGAMVIGLVAKGRNGYGRHTKKRGPAEAEAEAETRWRFCTEGEGEGDEARKGELF